MCHGFDGQLRATLTTASTGAARARRGSQRRGCTRLGGGGFDAECREAGGGGCRATRRRYRDLKGCSLLRPCATNHTQRAAVPPTLRSSAKTFRAISGDVFAAESSRWHGTRGSRRCTVAETSGGPYTSTRQTHATETSSAVPRDRGRPAAPGRGCCNAAHPALVRSAPFRNRTAAPRLLRAAQKKEGPHRPHRLSTSTNSGYSGSRDFGGGSSARTGTRTTAACWFRLTALAVASNETRPDAATTYVR